MALADDGDPIRGVGLVTIYAAYLEEQIDQLLTQLEVLERVLESGAALADRSEAGQGQAVGRSALVRVPGRDAERSRMRAPSDSSGGMRSCTVGSTEAPMTDRIP